jgi:hypothetical protein
VGNNEEGIFNSLIKSGSLEKYIDRATVYKGGAITGLVDMTG